MNRYVEARDSSAGGRGGRSKVSGVAKSPAEPKAATAQGNYVDPEKVYTLSLKPWGKLMKEGLIQSVSLKFTSGMSTWNIELAANVAKSESALGGLSPSAAWSAIESYKRKQSLLLKKNELRDLVTKYRTRLGAEAPATWLTALAATPFDSSVDLQSLLIALPFRVCAIMSLNRDTYRRQYPNGATLGSDGIAVPNPSLEGEGSPRSEKSEIDEA